MANKQLSIWEDFRLTLDDSVQMSLDSLRAYGKNYDHWACAYSGGKDSSATVTLTAWAIKNRLIPRPKSFTVLYANTRLELEPLYNTAVGLMSSLVADGFKAVEVLPEMDDRFFVYMLGRGVPPPKNRFRWCTPKLKIKPMMQALENLRTEAGEKLLMITGVRLGESAARDKRIALSCSKDSGECGQGWFQTATDKSVADTLAPLLHWRVCHIYDWLYFDDRHGYDVTGIAAVYGDGDVRTGCVGCNLASRDVALERLVKKPEFEHLRPLVELKPLYRELKKPQHRLRKSEPEMRKDGKYSKNVQRLGPLTMDARKMALETIVDIQERSGFDLINQEEKARIIELWQENTWPNGWSGEEITGDVAIDAMFLSDSGEIITQPLLAR